ALETELPEPLVHAQEHLLAQLAGVLGLADHALHDVPDQRLVPPHQLGKGIVVAGHRATNPFAFLIHAPTDTSSGRTVAPASPAVRSCVSRCNRWPCRRIYRSERSQCAPERSFPC